MKKTTEQQLAEANREIERLKADRDKPRRKVCVGGPDKYGFFYWDTETKEPVTAQEAASCEIVNETDKCAPFTGSNRGAGKIFLEAMKRRGRR